MTSIDGFALTEATHSQFIESVKRQLPEWGGGLSEAEFIERERVLGATEFGRGRKCWILTSTDQVGTDDFFCSCETYRRPVLFSDSPHPLISYGIASVFTGLHHRKKGYAKKMMTMLHSVIGLPAGSALAKAPSYEGPEWNGGKDGVLSFLYSDVGDFYSRCGPPGWHVLGAIQTAWKVDDLPQNAFITTSATPNLVPLTESDFPSLAQIDSSPLPSLVRSLSTSSSPAFALPPSASGYSWSTLRTKYFAEVKGKLTPTSWGARIGELGSGKESFVTWTMDYGNSILNVNRLVVNPSAPQAGAALLREALKAARENGCKSVEAWNVDEKVLGVLEDGIKGTTEERKEHLSAVALYAHLDGSVKAQDLRWHMNEHFSWL